MSILPKQSEINPTSNFWLSAAGIKKATAPILENGSDILATPILSSPTIVYSKTFTAPENGTLVAVGSVTIDNASNGNDRTFTLTLTDGGVTSQTTVRNVGTLVDNYRTATTIYNRTLNKGVTITLSLTLACNTPGSDVLYLLPGLQCIFSPT